MPDGPLEKLGFRTQASHHWEPHLAVGLSALLFLAPAGAQSAVALCLIDARVSHSLDTRVQLVLYSALSVLYTGAVVTCCLADYTYIRRGHRSTFGKFDIRWASLTYVLSVLSFALRAPAGETLVLALTPMFAFAFAGMSPSLRAWVFRHSLWHVVGAAIGTLGALRHVPEPATTEVCMWSWLQTTEMALYGAALVGLSALYLMPEATRRSLWNWGAAHADWKPVDGFQGALLTEDCEASG